MVGLLGNFKGTVKPWWLPFDLVFCRITNKNLITKVAIVKNSNVRNVYGLAVEINNGVVVRAWHGMATPNNPQTADESSWASIAKLYNPSKWK
jgi:hypothetical protein